MKASVDVHNFLQSYGIPHEIFLVDSPAKTAERTAIILGKPRHEIVKTVLFNTSQGHFVAILPGNKRANYRKLKRAAHSSEVRLATPKDVMEVTGYILGATPPVAHEAQLPVYIDPEVLQTDFVYTAAGEANAILKIKSANLAKVTGAKIVEFAR